jgi:predicted dehydrogenase
VPEWRWRGRGARPGARGNVRAPPRHPKVAQELRDLLADDAIDAIYNPLPNGLHASGRSARSRPASTCCARSRSPRTRRGDADGRGAERTGRVLIEAFHWRYHPLAARMREVVQTELGESVTSRRLLCFPLPFSNDIRYSWELAAAR